MTDGRTDDRQREWPFAIAPSNTDERSEVLSFTDMMTSLPWITGPYYTGDHERQTSHVEHRHPQWIRRDGLLVDTEARDDCCCVITGRFHQPVYDCCFTAVVQAQNQYSGIPGSLRDASNRSTHNDEIVVDVRLQKLLPARFRSMNQENVWRHKHYR